MKNKKNELNPEQMQPNEKPEGVASAPQEPLESGTGAPAYQEPLESKEAALAASEAPEDTPMNDTEGDLAIVKSSRGLNLREGPHYQFEVLEVLEDGSVVAVLELPCGAKVPGWALVHTGHQAGWVDRGFLQAVEE